MPYDTIPTIHHASLSEKKEEEKGSSCFGLLFVQCCLFLFFFGPLSSFVFVLCVVRLFVCLVCVTYAYSSHHLSIHPKKSPREEEMKIDT